MALQVTRSVPIDCMILTRRGWLTWDAVQVGDETIGYNPQTGRSEWTPFTALHYYEHAPLVHIGNARWHATVPPEHRWVTASRVHVLKQPMEGRCFLCDWPTPPASREPLASCPECGWRPVAISANGVQIHRSRKHGVPRPPKIDRRVHRGATTTGGLRIHLAKAHGIEAEQQENEYAAAQFVQTKEIDSRDRLILSAVADTGPGLPITDQEAAILGWIAGDGHVEKYVHKPGGRKKPTISIAQSKLPMVAKIDALMTGIPHARYAYPAAPSRVHGKKCPDRHTWRLDKDYAQDLMRRAGHPKEQAVAQVLGMSGAQRRAWLDAFIDAEGHRVGEYVTVSQAHGPVLEAAHLAIYLCGYRPRLMEVPRENAAWSPTAHVSAGRPVVSGGCLKKTDAGRGPVWCVTTELGTWTADQDGQILLTGNSEVCHAGGGEAGHVDPAVRRRDQHPATRGHSGV
jgi:hypothetical protein